MTSLRHGWTRSAISAPATDEKECAKAHSRAEARLLRQPSTPAPSAHPRGAFLFHRTHFPMKLKSPMSEPEKEQTWDFSIFMQVPAKALTAATTTPPGTLHT